MMGSKLRAIVVLALVAAALLALGGMALAQEGMPPASLGTPEGEVFAEGFNGPMGVLLDPDGNVWVIDSGVGGDEVVEGVGFDGAPMTGTMGMSAQIVKINAADGSQEVLANLPSLLSGFEAEGGSRLALLDGVLYATGPGWHPMMIPATAEEPLPLTGGVLRVEADGTVTRFADLWEIERDQDPAGGEMDNHPYGLLAGPDGNLWVADAGSNALYRVDPATGEAEVVAAFEPLPGVFPNPNYGGEMLTDPVPTGVAVMDGEVYVSLLSGAPFIPGSAKVLKVAEDGTVSDYATGLTMLTDLRTGPDGQLYATSFGMFTDQGPVPNSGGLLRIGAGDASEMLVSGLPFATSVDFDADGNAYVTINGLGAPGSGQVLKFAGATEMSGTPVAEMMAAMAGPGAGEAAMAEATPEATEEAMAEATAEPTEEATEEAMAEATAEPTEEAAEEAMAEATAEPTEEAAEEAMAEATAEATEEAMEEAAATAEPSEEPTPEMLPVTGDSTPGGWLFAAAAGVLALIGGAALFLRRRAA